MLPDLRRWREWTYDDYVRFFLSREGARLRLSGSDAPLDMLSGASELRQFCAPVRSRIRELFGHDAPRVSIVIVAYNEERQLIPTLLSYTLLDGIGDLAELIVVDNNSTDRTREVIEACGARYVSCEEQGTPFARAAGLAKASPGAEYLWMSDADVRVVRPYQPSAPPFPMSTVFRTSYEYMESHPDIVGVSSGAVPEETHWSYRLLHETAIALGRTSPYSCWSGSNQFVRKWALEASGGIDTSVLFGEDQHRHFQLARWARENDKHLNSANMDEDALGDPVYFSGRRYATFALVASHLIDVLGRRYVKKGDHWTETEHRTDLDWRHVR